MMPEDVHENKTDKDDVTDEVATKTETELEEHKKVDELAV
jgi:hypothetical protein